MYMYICIEGRWGKTETDRGQQTTSTTYIPISNDCPWKGLADKR